MSTTKAIESRLSRIHGSNLTLDEHLEEIGLIARDIEYCESDWTCPPELVQRLTPIFVSAIDVSREIGHDDTARRLKHVFYSII